MHLQNENYYVQLLKLIRVRPKIKALKICYLKQKKTSNNSWSPPHTTVLFQASFLKKSTKMMADEITKAYGNKIPVQQAMNECRPWQSHMQNLRERIKIDQDRCSVF